MDAEYVHADILFQIVGDHPHTGEYCHPVGETPETVSELNGLTLMRLVNCEHNVRGCYAARENLRLLHGRTAAAPDAGTEGA
jgi:hypothetical protein